MAPQWSNWTARQEKTKTEKRLWLLSFCYKRGRSSMTDLKAPQKKKINVSSLEREKWT